MPASARPLLERHKILHSRDREEAHVFLDSKGFRLELPRRPDAPLDMRVNCAIFPGLSVGYLQIGPAVTNYAKEPGDDYLVTLPVRGRLDAKLGGNEVVADPRKGIVFGYPPMPADVLRMEAGCGRINVTINGAALRRQLGALLGRPLDQPLVFAPEIALSHSYGCRLTGYLRLAIAEFEAEHAMPWDARTATQFEQVMLTELLLSQPSNYADALRPFKPIAPRDIKRAIDYLEAHLDMPVTVADLVAVSQVAGRTLFQHFRDFKGISPMRYLREARFVRVRQALLQAELEDSVTAIAGSWGFTHMGRFAVEYRGRFGERPIDTLRRHRRSHNNSV